MDDNSLLERVSLGTQSLLLTHSPPPAAAANFPTASPGPRHRRHPPRSPAVFEYVSVARADAAPDPRHIRARRRPDRPAPCRGMVPALMSAGAGGPSGFRRLSPAAGIGRLAPPPRAGRIIGRRRERSALVFRTGRPARRRITAAHGELGLPVSFNHTIRAQSRSAEELGEFGSPRQLMPGRSSPLPYLPENGPPNSCGRRIRRGPRLQGATYTHISTPESLRHGNGAAERLHPERDCQGIGGLLHRLAHHKSARTAKRTGRVGTRRNQVEAPLRSAGGGPRTNASVQIIRLA